MVEAHPTLLKLFSHARPFFSPHFKSGGCSGQPYPLDSLRCQLRVERNVPNSHLFVDEDGFDAT